MPPSSNHPPAQKPVPGPIAISAELLAQRRRGAQASPRHDENRARHPNGSSAARPSGTTISAGASVLVEPTLDLPQLRTFKLERRRQLYEADHFTAKIRLRHRGLEWTAPGTKQETVVKGDAPTSGLNLGDDRASPSSLVSSRPCSTTKEIIVPRTKKSPRR